MKIKKKYLILHNIRSVINVGSIFRTAECAGVDKIFLTGYTPSPLDRFKKPRKDFIKASLGAEKHINWEHDKNISKIILNLKKDNVLLAAVEQNKKSIDYKTFKTNKNVAFVFGNEVSGLSQNILKKSDVILEIPIIGKKESLNVSVSCGIVLFRVLNI